MESELLSMDEVFMSMLLEAMDAGLRNPEHIQRYMAKKGRNYSLKIIALNVDVLIAEGKYT